MSKPAKRPFNGLFVGALLLAIAGAALFYWASTITFDPATDSGAGEVKKRIAEVARYVWMGAGAMGGIGVLLRLTGR